MARAQIIDENSCFQLTCGRCVMGRNFTVFIDPTGVTCHCLACGKNYKLESPGGVKIANA